MNSDWPELYANNNEFQREFAKRVWQWFVSDMNAVVSQSKFNAVIDFGCGTGEITANMPTWISNMDQQKSENGSATEASSLELIIGMDISPKMIEYCHSHHLKSQSNFPTSMEFVVADAGDPSSMKPAWRSKFDFLYSFCAMNWVPDQRKALQSFRFCLKERGLVLLLIPLDCAAFTQIIDEELITKRWSEYLSNYSEDWKSTPGWEKYTAWKKPDPAVGYAQLAVESGFHVLHSEVQQFRYLFDGETKFETAFMPIIASLKLIPEEKRKQFMEELAEEYRKLVPREMGQNGEFVDVFDLKTLIVVLQKSAN